MTKVGIIRCEKNEQRCPLTSGFRCMMETREAFQIYESVMPIGVFTCRCPGDSVVELAKILKAKGAEVIHFTTCTFAKKEDKGWSMERGGFCDHIDELIEKVHRETGIPCVKGTAHLPKDYVPRQWT